MKLRSCGKRHPYCKECKPEVSAKLCKAQMGRKHTDEARAKMSKAHTGKGLGNTYALGYKHTDETKAKIGEASRGNTHNLGNTHRRREVGSTSMNNGYLIRKTTNPAIWKFEHLIVWEAAHGPAPKGHLVHHIDENKLNNTLSNLQLITISEHRKIHGFQRALVPNKTRYRYTRIGGVFRQKHRVVWEVAYGPIPEGYEVHHANADKGDNRLENLKLMTRIEHMRLEAKKKCRPKACAV